MATKRQGLRADQWIMLGVGALGAFAVYRLLTRPSPPAGLPDANGGQAGPVTPVTPEIPNAGTPSFGTLNWIGRPPAAPGSVVVSTNQTYRGRTDGLLRNRPVPTSEGAQAELARVLTNDVRSELADLGFTNVRVFTEQEVRGTEAFPLQQPFAGATPQSRFFIATWSGEPGVVAVPPWLSLIYPTVIGA